MLCSTHSKWCHIIVPVEPQRAYAEGSANGHHSVNPGEVRGVAERSIGLPADASTAHVDAAVVVIESKRLPNLSNADPDDVLHGATAIDNLQWLAIFPPDDGPDKREP